MSPAGRVASAARGKPRSIVARPTLLLAAAAVLAVAAFQLWITPPNPPGYHRDEASISLNGYLLSTSLRDEDGNLLPLVLRAFDDYRGALHSYLLAGVFTFTGPDPQVARGLSAVLVLAAVLLLGLLARRLTASTPVAVVTVVLAGFTPWLYELGRVAHEVSSQPLLVALLLIVLERTWRERRWTAARGAGAGLVLATLVYAYTGSRLLGPLLAGALLVFASRGRWTWLLSAWGAFVLLLVPLGVYGLRHPGALTARYDATTIARDGLSGPKLVLQAVGNWFEDFNPWRWATSGDPVPYLHTGGHGSVFAAVVVLALAGSVVVLRRQRDDLWWRYVLVATLLVPVPAALTVDRYSAVRLSALPVFLLVLAIPALQSLVVSWRSWPARTAAVVLMLSVIVQLVQFQDAYRTRGPGRAALFEAGVGPLLEHGFETGGTLYVDFDDRRAQAHARWHAAANGLRDERVVVLPDGGVAPGGSTVFGLFQECDFVCEEVARWEEYWLARAIGPRTTP